MKGRLRLRLPRHVFNGYQKYISLCLADTPENREIAKAKAKQIEADIKLERFDSTLERYRATVYESPPARASSLPKLWEQYAGYRAPMLARGSQKILRSTTNKLKQCPHKSLDKAHLVKDWLLANGSPESARRVLQQLNACCKWAVEQKLIEDNPFEKLQRLKKKSHSQIEPFTPSEREAIINAFESSSGYSHYAPFVKFLFLTGCRPSEAIALRWQDIDPARASLTFASAVVEGERKSTKTNTVRTFPINAALKSLLDSMPQTHAVVFPAPKGGLINMQNFARRAWRSTLAGLPIRFRSAYKCRHTFITECLRSGIPIKQVAAWVGNSPEVLLKHYAGLTGEEVPEF